jgi:hypothetical protein
MRGSVMAASKRIQAVSEDPDENLGLLANGSSGPWEVSIDESVSGVERSFAQIEGPSLWLYFEIPSPDIIPKMIQFLLPPGTKREEMPSRSSRRSNKLLDISKPEETPVSLVRDDEYKDRCFIVVGRSDSPIVRFSIAGEDLDNLVEALRQVEADIRPSASSEEKTNGVKDGGGIKKKLMGAASTTEGWQRKKRIAKAGRAPMPGTRGRYALLLPAGPGGLLLNQPGVKSPRYAHWSYDNAGRSYRLRDFLTGQELSQDSGLPAESIWSAALDRVKLVGPSLQRPVDDAAFWHDELARWSEEYHRSRSGRP